jgi:HAD superfamily phosphoserine phosphatase-like hydrolase
LKLFDLVAFDIDGTLVLSSEGRTVWEVLNRRFLGTAGFNKQRYALYKQGKLSYSDWVALDINGWRDAGATKEAIIAAFAPLTLTTGARDTLTKLKHEGVKLFAISGTLDIMFDTLYPDHPFEEVYANRMEFDERGNITGWRATPFDMEGKAEALRAISARAGVPLERCAFIGDSTNDLWIARQAGFAIAFNSNSTELDELADAVVQSTDLRDILPYLVKETK